MPLQCCLLKLWLHHCAAPTPESNEQDTEEEVKGSREGVGKKKGGGGGGEREGKSEGGGVGRVMKLIHIHYNIKKNNNIVSVRFFSVLAS